MLGATRCFPGKASKKRGRRVFSQECVGVEDVMLQETGTWGEHNPTIPRTARLFWKQEENESCAPGLKDLQDTVLPSRMFTVGVAKDLVMDEQGFSKHHPHRRTYIRRHLHSSQQTSHLHKREGDQATPGNEDFAGDSPPRSGMC